MKKAITCFALLLTANLSFLSLAEPIWIDVRSELEHKIDHIDGDVRIPHDEIVQGVGQIFLDKNIEIRLYCRSGGRAGKALTALQKAGYTNVENVGGINEARKARALNQ